MKITALIENTTSKQDIKPQHGLSLYIETQKHKILIDTGSDDTFLSNAQKLGIDISAVDIMIITHGHYDHGGGLKTFMLANKTAKVYVQATAFDRHYTKILGLFKINVGINNTLMTNSQIVLVDGDMHIDDEIRLITYPTGNKLLPKFNKSLFVKKDNRYIRDVFDHEQSVIIADNKTVLIGGCAHRGIVNIINDAEQKKGKPIDVCISGFYLFNPLTKATVMLA